jgi:hypothetical protein
LTQVVAIHPAWPRNGPMRHAKKWESSTDFACARHGAQANGDPNGTRTRVFSVKG